MNDPHSLAGSNHVSPEEQQELIELSKKPPTDLEILKDGSRSQVGAYQLASGREVVLKYYLPKNLIKKIGNRFRQTRCQKSGIAALGFARLNIPTPTALACLDRYLLGLVNSMSFLATDRAHGIQLREIPTDRLTQLVPALKSAFTEMSKSHISHGDLKASNIIVSDANEINFIDLDATRFQLKGKVWERARTYDRERFLRNWEDDPAAQAILKPCFDELHG